MTKNFKYFIRASIIRNSNYEINLIFYPLNKLKVNAAIYGNHEFDHGLPRLKAELLYLQTLNLLFFLQMPCSTNLNIQVSNTF